MPTPNHKFVPILALLAALSALSGRALAADPEGCLMCHQYRGLSRIAADGKTIDLFYVNPNYYDQALGPHAHLKCTDCHEKKDVEVFPHKAATPVDCLRTCHVVSSSNVELRFSHAKLSQLLDHSVHTKKVLEESNQLLGAPLAQGQADCLLCHDEPLFARSEKGVLRQQAPIARCNTCHDEQFPQDTRYFYWHVHARSQPARSHLDLVRLCGACHSNPAIREQFKLPDTSASYLVSFHGKAALLGSQETAGCLDCHVGPGQNIHAMLSQTKTDSPTHSDQIANTCRTCHREAGPRISSAAIHLDLSTSHGIEFFIACIFVVLIVFTFGPSLLMTALKMFHNVIGRHDPEVHDRLHRLDKLLATPQTAQKLQRFTLHQRLQHWYLVICFTVLVVTGFPIKFADRAWAATLVRELGGLPTTRSLHHWFGALLIAGFVYHMVYVMLTVKRQRKKTGIIRAVLGLPMMVTLNDLKGMNLLMLYLLGLRQRSPESGRFNPEEKFEYIGVFWGTFVLGTTGCLMWFNAWTSRHMPGRLLTIAVLIHTFEAFLALLHVGVVHMASVIFAPGVFPVSKAMFTGQTPAHELAEGHAAMIDDAEKETPHA